MNEPLSIKKISFFKPADFVESVGSKREASDLLEMNEVNWNRNSKGKLVACVEGGDHYFFVKDRDEFYG